MKESTLCILQAGGTFIYKPLSLPSSQGAALSLLLVGRARATRVAL